MLALLTGSGFAAAAGLNAFIPLAFIGALAKSTSLIELSPGFRWLASWPAILIALLLIVVELVLDKIPGVDSVNDVLQTPIRPAAGALAFAAGATAHIGGGPVVSPERFWSSHIWLAWTAGALIGAAMHFSKAASRTAISADTGGAGTPLASFAGEGIAIALCLFATIVPWLVVPMLAGIVIAVYRIVTIGRRRRRGLAERQRRWRAEREAREAEEGLTGWLAARKERILALAARASKEGVRWPDGKGKSEKRQKKSDDERKERRERKDAKASDKAEKAEARRVRRAE